MSDSSSQTNSQLAAEPVILASTSRTRSEMLLHAGISCEQVAARIDEDGIKELLRAGQVSASATAEALAERKARFVSGQFPTRLVIGADQVLACNAAVFDKPMNREDACAQLKALRGRVHEQISAVCVMLDGEILWQYSGRAVLLMRPFSDDFISLYLDAIGKDAFISPGGYQIEGHGIQLFSRIDGDFFTILGLPLLPLLEYLRSREVLRT